LTEENIPLEYTKADFLLLCEQYATMGQFIVDMAQEIGTESKTAPHVARVAEQHLEMGEQLKAVGTGLDNLGVPL